jgi:DNA invertase Pin-like site-specific DNA recombinase
VLGAAQRGDVDVVLVWKLDRFGRIARSKRQGCIPMVATVPKQLLGGGPSRLG